jgi:hypothetical protein
MKKPLPPEVLALIPDGIENLVLSCTVCREPLPISRRAVGDHAGACHKVRVLHRKYAIRLARCISCLHPSTPEERELFKAWRRSRGELREHGGRPKRAPKSPTEAIDTEAFDSLACE